MKIALPVFACVGCQAPFQPRRRDQRWCSEKCRWNARRIPTIPSRGCDTCGAQYAPRVREQRFCSRSCNNKHHSARKDTGLRRRQCEICAAPYRPTYPAQRTCGRACGIELRRREDKFKRERRKWPKCDVRYQRCLECDALFVARQERSRLCSASCDAKRRYREHKQQLPATRDCPCGALVERPRRVCDECLRRGRIERKKQEKRRRRAAKRGGASERYTLAEIAERDRHCCALCGDPVPMDVKVPEPLAPTIDHIVPVSRGGDDTKVNVQLAHFRCNSVKGARDVQRLALAS